ncbi:hypothetical protein NXH76_14280 [Blautia schinkii]|nr:hypothetical protein [Blautia schinkii]
MCREMDEIYYEGIEFGEKCGEMKAKRETALSLAEMGIPVEKIAQAVKVSVSLVKKWISEDMALAK